MLLCDTTSIARL
uniref:Uncharacterized protein n=1 Tax=Anguilla anguilla TaxID=7936 RepID=A0A0E9V075_ANGAN